VQIIDILDDLRRINRLAMFSINTGMIILGGGVIKHHICNANLMRNGADFRFVLLDFGQGTYRACFVTKLDVKRTNLKTPKTPIRRQN
jgi:hypothetical protein